MIATHDISAADWRYTTPEQLLHSHLERTGNTARSYAGDMATLAEFLAESDSDVGGSVEPVDSVRAILEKPRGAVVRMMHNYLAWLRQRYSLNSARRKVSSLRGLLTLAHEFGVVPWAIQRFPLPTPEPIRDTRGPRRDDVMAMIDVCERRGDAKGYRDAAMLRLMGFGALRCNEVMTLDIKHLDVSAYEIEIAAKGLWGTQRKRHPIDMLTVRCINRWLDFRGLADGPLFTTLRPGATDSGDRISYPGVYSVVRKIGRAVGVRCHPHALRHHAATEFLRLTNGNVSWAMALTRHRDPRTLMIYNDEAMTRARQAMEILSRGVPFFSYDPNAKDNY